MVIWIISFISEDYTECEYNGYSVEANSVQEAKDKSWKEHYAEVQRQAEDYDEEEYYRSDFEILEVKESEG